jgi:hypothetical protein
MIRFQTALSAAAALAALSAGALAAPQIVINELRIDEPGADVAEYVELRGPAGTVLDGLTYLVIGDGTAALGSGVIENVTALTGSIPASGYFVVATASFTLSVPDQVAGLLFENSDNVTHLLVEGFTGAIATDLDTDNDGVLDVTPWTAVIDQIAIVEEKAVPPTATEFAYGPARVGPDGTFAPGHLYRESDGSGTLVHWTVGNFTTGVTDTPGAANAAFGRLPAAVGGCVGVQVQAGLANAGKFYWVVYSGSGTAPGTPLSAAPLVILPLNFDGITSLSLSQPNIAPFVNSFGALDASGNSPHGMLALPALPTAVGLTINGAAAIFDFFGISSATNSIALTLD